MDLTVGRLVQVRDVILTRRRYRWRRQVRLEEAKTRTLAMHVQGSRGHKAGVEAAAGIAFQSYGSNGGPKAEPVSAEKFAARFGRPEVLTDEQLQAIAAGAGNG